MFLALFIAFPPLCLMPHVAMAALPPISPAVDINRFEPRLLSNYEPDPDFPDAKVVVQAESSETYAAMGVTHPDYNAPSEGAPSVDSFGEFGEPLHYVATADDPDFFEPPKDTTNKTDNSNTTPKSRNDNVNSNSSYDASRPDDDNVYHHAGTSESGMHSANTSSKFRTQAFGLATGISPVTYSGIKPIVHMSWLNPNGVTYYSVTNTYIHSQIYHPCTSRCSSVYIGPPLNNVFYAVAPVYQNGGSGCAYVVLSPTTSDEGSTTGPDRLYVYGCTGNFGTSRPYWTGTYFAALSGGPVAVGCNAVDWYGSIVGNSRTNLYVNSYASSGNPTFTPTYQLTASVTSIGSTLYAAESSFILEIKMRYWDAHALSQMATIVAPLNHSTTESFLLFEITTSYGELISSIESIAPMHAMLPFSAPIISDELTPTFGAAVKRSGTSYYIRMNVGTRFFYINTAKTLAARFRCTVTNGNLQSYAGATLSVSARPAASWYDSRSRVLGGFLSRVNPTYTYTLLYTFSCGNYQGAIRVFTPEQLKLNIEGHVRSGVSGSDNLFTAGFRTWYGTGMEGVFSGAGYTYRGTIRTSAACPMRFSTNSMITNAGCMTTIASTNTLEFTCAAGATLGSNMIELNVTNVAAPSASSKTTIPAYGLMIYLESTTGNTEWSVVLATSMANAFDANLLPVSFTYSAISLELSPGTVLTNVATTVSGTFILTSRLPISVGSWIEYFPATTSVNFASAAVISGQCSFFSASASQIRLIVTATSKGAQSDDVVSCTIGGISVVYANQVSRENALDPYTLKPTSIMVRTPDYNAGYIAEYAITLRPANAINYYWYAEQIDRVLVPSATIVASRQLRTTLRLYFYSTNPVDATIPYTIASTCSDLNVFTASSSITPLSVDGFRVSSGVNSGVEFDVAVSTHYSLSLDCLSVTSTAGSTRRIQSATLALSSYSRHLDFVAYPIAARLTATGLNPALDDHGAAPVLVDWECIVYAHTALPAAFGFDISSAQAVMAPRVVMQSTTNATTTGFSSPMTKLSCDTTTRVSDTVVRFSGCSAISGSNYLFNPRILRFGPVLTTYAQYMELFNTYTVSTGLLAGYNGAAASIPQQNIGLLGLLGLLGCGRAEAASRSTAQGRRRCRSPRCGSRGGCSRCRPSWSSRSPPRCA